MGHWVRNATVATRAAGRHRLHMISTGTPKVRTRTVTTHQELSEQVTAPDVHTTAGKLADLERRMDEAVHAGSARAVEKQHAKGRRTARERIEMLFDEGSFVELDELARHRSSNFGLERIRP